MSGRYQAEYFIKCNLDQFQDLVTKLVKEFQGLEEDGEIHFFNESSSFRIRKRKDHLLLILPVEDQYTPNTKELNILLKTLDIISPIISLKEIFMGDEDESFEMVREYVESKNALNTIQYLDQEGKTQEYQYKVNPKNKEVAE